MAGVTNPYEVDETRLTTGYRFLFVSEGYQKITKAVQYSYIQTFEDRSVYNLGFGDFDFRLNDIEDQVKSKNGDAYRVFKTVLSTVPLFFERLPTAMLMVQGSDGGPDFVTNCQKVCIRNCTALCRKANQRIAVYRGYVDKNFLHLSLEYWFLGGFVTNQNQITIERYISGRKYDAILLFKK
ncbi:DUF6934 family protein [Dyadobacter sp.]|uniref:DUF6934 family protein n=1 Tax=Dyadobacter sp. TaxID=1914288 RepID=UPI003F7007D0